ELSDRRPRVPKRQGADFFDLPPILVAERNVIQQVFDSRDAQPGQLLGPARPDPLHELDRFFQGRLRRTDRRRRSSRWTRWRWEMLVVHGIYWVIESLH